MRTYADRLAETIENGLSISFDPNYKARLRALRTLVTYANSVEEELRRLERSDAAVGDRAVSGSAWTRTPCEPERAASETKRDA